MDLPTPPYNASDPSAQFLNSSCLDFLLIELVPMAYRVANELVTDNPAATIAGAAATTTASSQPPNISSPPPEDPGVVSPTSAAATASNRNSVATGTAATTATATKRTGAGGGAALDEDEERDAVIHRLDSLGYRVGLGLVERFSRDRPRFNDTLDAIKFVCKDLWMLVFKKQVDNLKTNHRGVYVLTDNSFRPFARMSTDAGGQVVVRAQPFLWFPCGVLRGALAAMGITADVQAETTDLPGAVFQIKTIGPSAK